MNLVMRHPAVIASSIATVAGTAPGRTMLTYGAGDTAVRLMGRSPATVARLADAVTLTRELLRGGGGGAGRRATGPTDPCRAGSRLGCSRRAAHAADGRAGGGRGVRQGRTPPGEPTGGHRRGTGRGDPRRAGIRTRSRSGPSSTPCWTTTSNAPP
ncbi:LLM class flavin-dependent oxidoreductase [Streptomyces sp. A1-5]|nr:LLM class flavin-dependent oxidoreductase [Streptomyces sp. A1-5]